ncbi:hypothetical protein TrRE_jg9654 [Triparma retinervis]|uniref:Glutamate-1-semialdehyde 2,1-aminomutase n=1 Tax=Triparma retinervis TaxID=2557542 RepID=A0A9W7G8A2_9STRA|nr:hypothetical protein TrRE_jg9654 [Triparma retinervis]
MVNVGRCPVGGVLFYRTLFSALKVAFLPPTSPLSPDVSFVLSLLPLTLNVPLPSNLLDEVCYLSLGFAVLILPEVYRKLLTLCAMHVASIAPPYVSTVLGSFSHSDDACLRADGAPDDVAEQRKKAFADLIDKLAKLFPKSSKIYDEIDGRFSDIRFFDVKKVFFPFREMAKKLSVCVVATKTDGPYLVDADGHKILDVSGSYGVNVIGYEGFKSIGNRAHKETLNDLGPVLGPIHPDLRGALSMLSDVSGQPECSLHMSGTEAVMCATRLARFNTKKKFIVTFGAAYHGWYDAVQPGVGNERPVPDIIVLKDQSPVSLQVIRSRAHEIAAVIVNPLQAFTPNQPPPSDGTLIGKVRDSGVTNAREDFRKWLLKLRATCSKTGVVLIFDEVYTGFRLAPGGAQEYFNVKADMICYGKALAGGMPIGAVCGPAELMRRYDPDHPLRLCYLVGTFSAHPSIVTMTKKFLEDVKKIDYQKKHDEGHPVRLAHFASVWLFQYTEPGRFHWLMQYYLRSRMVNLAWVGTGRLSFSLDFNQEHLSTLRASILLACQDMEDGGWWWTSGPNHSSVIKKMVNKEIAWSLTVSAGRKIRAMLGLGRGAGGNRKKAI